MIVGLGETFYGGEGNDTIVSSGSATLVDGSYQITFFDDGAGQSLFGGEGNDLLYVGAGDTVTGGTGNDTFIVSDLARNSSLTTVILGGDGTDRIVANLADGTVLSTSGSEWFFAAAYWQVVSVEEIQIGTGGPVFQLDGTTQTFTSNVDLYSGDITVGMDSRQTQAWIHDAGTYTYHAAAGIEDDAALTIYSASNQMLNYGYGPLRLWTTFGYLDVTPDGANGEWDLSYTAFFSDSLRSLILSGAQIQLGTGLHDMTVSVAGVTASGASTRFGVSLYLDIEESLDLKRWGLSQGADIMGSAAANNVAGTAHGDVIDGADGQDTIAGGLGGDTLSGGRHSDRITGQTGADLLYGGSGNDRLYGGTESDSLYGGSGDDLLSGGEDADWLYGGAGADILTGDAGDDELNGHQGNDSLYGGDGKDTLSGGAGDDLLQGGAGNDKLMGSAGDDILSGGDGNDKLYGGDGNDTLDAGAGHATLTGGAGADLFVFMLSDAPETGPGRVLIGDFTFGEDQLHIRLASDPDTSLISSDLVDRMTDVGGNAVLALAGGPAITFTGVTVEDFVTNGGWLFGEP